MKLHPGVRIDLSAGGAGKGMTDVLADVVDLGMVSREVYPPELEKGAVPFASAKDAVVITINSDNPYADKLIKHGISKEVAAKIWITGEYVTWGRCLELTIRLLFMCTQGLMRVARQRLSLYGWERSRRICSELLSLAIRDLLRQYRQISWE